MNPTESSSKQSSNKSTVHWLKNNESDLSRKWFPEEYNSSSPFSKHTESEDNQRYTPSSILKNSNSSQTPDLLSMNSFTSSQSQGSMTDIVKRLLKASKNVGAGKFSFPNNLSQRRELFDSFMLDIQNILIQLPETLKP